MSTLHKCSFDPTDDPARCPECGMVWRRDAHGLWEPLAIVTRSGHVPPGPYDYGPSPTLPDPGLPTGPGIDPRVFAVIAVAAVILLVAAGIWAALA